MVREISAGGVVVRRAPEGWQIAVIEPQKEAAAVPPASAKKKTSQKMLLALPKGLVDPGEKPEQTAVREVVEETGLTAVPITKLGDTKYAYVRTWGDQERVFKIVSFYLFRYQSGEIDEIAPEMRIEVSAHCGFLWKMRSESWPTEARRIWFAGPRPISRLIPTFSRLPVRQPSYVHSSRARVICNLDCVSHGVYVEFNLIEARAAAILTPHLMRHAPAVFMEPFRFPPTGS